MSDFTLERLLALEHEGWDSLCQSRGGTFYGDLMTPGAVMVLVNGMVLDRDTIAGSLGESPPWSAYTISDPRLVHIGADAAALVYTARASRDGSDEAFVALMSSTYCQVEGRTRLALYQQTTITH